MVADVVAAERSFDISIARRHIENGISTLRVKQGDQVIIRWRTDEAASVHLHGYDIAAALTPSAPVRMRFTADVTGRFRITAHRFGEDQAKNDRRQTHHELPLLYLEVHP
ncbi:MAG: hypothetical protein ACREX0_02840 [Noviherbaspirillum sp.]